MTQVVDVHFVMVAHPSLPVPNVKQLIALAKVIAKQKLEKLEVAHLQVANQALWDGVQ